MKKKKGSCFRLMVTARPKVLDELYMTARFTRNPEQRDMVRGLMAKLRVLSDEQCMDLVIRISIRKIIICLILPALWESGLHWPGSNPGLKN